MFHRVIQKITLARFFLRYCVVSRLILIKKISRAAEFGDVGSA